MEKLMIGETIYILRKEKGITQEQLANSMRVSAAAVSKWESGCSYPDITLLPMLATFFNVSVDRLLNFKIELMDEEVMNLFCECEKLFSSGKLDEGIKKSKEYVDKYPGCYYLKFRMSFLFCMYSWKSVNEENCRNMMNDSIQLLEDIVQNCNNKELVDQALFQLGALYPSIEEEEKAIDALEKLKKSQLDPNMLLAGIYINRNEFGKARTILQTNLYKSINDIGMSCMGLANSHMKENKDLELVEKYYSLMINIKTAVSEVQGGAITEAEVEEGTGVEVGVQSQAEAEIETKMEVEVETDKNRNNESNRNRDKDKQNIRERDKDKDKDKDNGNIIEREKYNENNGDKNKSKNKQNQKNTDTYRLSLSMEYLSLAQIYLEMQEPQKAIHMLHKMREDIKQNDINKPERFNSIWCFNEIPAAKRTITMNLYENILKIFEHPAFDLIRAIQEFKDILIDIDSYKRASEY